MLFGGGGGGGSGRVCVCVCMCTHTHACPCMCVVGWFIGWSVILAILGIEPRAYH